MYVLPVPPSYIKRWSGKASLGFLEVHIEFSGFASLCDVGFNQSIWSVRIKGRTQGLWGCEPERFHRGGQQAAGRVPWASAGPASPLASLSWSAILSCVWFRLGWGCTITLFAFYIILFYFISSCQHADIHHHFVPLSGNGGLLWWRVSTPRWEVYWNWTDQGNASCEANFQELFLSQASIREDSVGPTSTAAQMCVLDL